MPTVDSTTRAAGKILADVGIELDAVFPAEVDDGFRWGVAHLPRPGLADKLQVLVGVPANGRFGAEELAAALRDGASDLLDLAPDEDLEIGNFRFEIL
jgi:hypothetical protein